MTDHCKYEGDLKEMRLLIGQHEKVLKDNGTLGLISNVNEIKHQLELLVKLIEERESEEDDIKKELEGIRTGLSGIVKSYEDLECWRKEKDDDEVKKAKAIKERADYQFRKSNLIVYIIVSASVIINIILTHLS